MVVYSVQIMVTGNYGLNFLYSVVNAHEGVTVSGEEGKTGGVELSNLPGN